MAKNMAALMVLLVVLLALLIPLPAFGAESPDDVPPMVDEKTVADKQFIDPLLASESDKNGGEATAEVDSQQRIDDLQRELLDTRRDFLDTRAKNVDSWLAATAIVLTFFGIISVIAGYLSFKRFGEIEAEASRNVDAAKEHAEAAKRLVDEIKGHRDEAKAQLEELHAEAASKNREEAARIAARVQRDPTSSDIARASAAAIQLQQQGEIEEAIEKWRSIANIAADRQLQAQAWLSIGYLHSVGEDVNWEEARDAYTKAIALDPTLAIAYNNRGHAEIELGQHQAALADLDRAIALDPTLAMVYNNRGHAEIELGQHQAALADLDRAIALDPTLAWAYNNRGWAKNELGQHQAALADLDRAIALDPTLAMAYNNRGWAKNELGQHQAALADLDRAIALDPTLAWAYNNRGWAKARLSRINEARADFQKALALAQEADAANIAAIAEHALKLLDSNGAPS